MADGWFDGLPYLLDDMRPQGFIGRNFARRHALLLQLSEDPARWSEDDVLHALSMLCADIPGNCIIGEAAYRQYLETLRAPQPFLEGDEESIAHANLDMAAEALQGGVAGPSAGGEFPKFAARRVRDAQKRHMLVKFSGDDASAGTQRWADLLVCEHLALSTVNQEPGIAAAQSCIYQSGGRAMLEVMRFDRHGENLAAGGARGRPLLGDRGRGLAHQRRVPRYLYGEREAAARPLPLSLMRHHHSYSNASPNFPSI
jgi:hypothetical protein